MRWLSGEPPGQRGDRSSGRRRAAPSGSLAASTTGQLFEWYEWTAYAVFATYIAGAMFNNENPVSALLATFAVFAVGFLMRPLGGIVFGRIADVRGRKWVLITTMLMMAAASLAIGLLPTYESIGITASILLLLCRMIQGFAHGGESATAYSYVAEIAPPHRRGMWGSLVFVAIMGGTVAAYGIGGGITRDMLVAQVPVVLRAELYAVAALAGAAVVVIGDRLELPQVPALVFGALLCFGLRFMAIRFGWRLPIAQHRET